MAGLWRNNPETPEGKYLVLRRDGTVPLWEWFVLGSNDPAAPTTLLLYADYAEKLGMDPQYIKDVRDMARSWLGMQDSHGTTGNPDAGPDVIDDPKIIAQMRLGGST